MHIQVRRRACWDLMAVCLLVLVFSGWLFAQGARKTRSGTIDADTVNVRKDGEAYVTVYSNATITQEESVFTAKTVEQRSVKGAHVFTCTGNPVYKSPESTILSDRLVANTSPRSAEFTGNVRATRVSQKEGQDGQLLGNSTTLVTSQRLLYDYGKKWAEFTGGDVVMETTPNDAAKVAGAGKESIAREPSRITCDKLTYDFTGKKAVATCNPGRQVHIVQQTKGRDLLADQAIYDEKMNILLLTGHVVMKNSGEGELKGVENVGTATISLDNDNDFIDLQKSDKQVKIYFDVNEDETGAH